MKYKAQLGSQLIFKNMSLQSLQHDNAKRGFSELRAILIAINRVVEISLDAEMQQQR